MRKIIWFVMITVLALSGGQAFSSKMNDSKSRLIRNERKSELVISGKLFCPIKRKILIPFEGIVTSFDANCGDPIKTGDVLAEYTLSGEAALTLHRRISSFKVDDLKLKISDIENELSDLEAQEESLRNLSNQDMAPSRSMIRVGREIALLKIRKQLVQKKLPLEEALERKDIEVVEDLLGKAIKDDPPSDGVIRSPIDGHILWVNSHFRSGAEFSARQQVFTVGTLDPMIIRAQVHEIEALQIHLGDKAEFTLESVPGRKFHAVVTRISWDARSSKLDAPSYYEVELEVANPKKNLREGLRGKIVFPPKKQWGVK